MEKLDYVLEKTNLLSAEINNLNESTQTNKTNIETLQTNVENVQDNITTLQNSMTVAQGNISNLQTATTSMQENFSNPNILINGDFRINQRGEIEYNNINAGSNKYTVDRWIHYISGDYTLTQNSGGGITIVNSHTSNVDFAQIIENGYNLLKGKTVTLSAKINGTVYSVTAVATNDGEVYSIYAKSNNLYTLRLCLQCTTGNVYKVFFQTLAGTTNSIDWIKLEIGKIATPFSYKPFAEELANCQRYYWKHSFADQMPIAVGIGRNSTTLGMILPIGKLRTNPTSIVNGKFRISNSPSTTNLTFSLNQYYDGFARYYCNTSGLTEGNAYLINGNSTGYLALDAEMY